MNKKVLMQVGCFLVMFALELVAAYVDPSSALHNVLLILALLMIPVFIIAGRMPEPSNSQISQIDTEEDTNTLAKTA